MIGLSTSSQTRQLIASFNGLGVTPPTIITEAAERAERIAAGARQLGSSDGLAEAVARAITTGADPAADPEVQRILNRAAIGSIATEVERVANDQLVATLNANTDKIVSGWRKPFDDAAQTLLEAHAVLGSVALEDTTQIVQRGGDAAEAWGRAQRGSASIDHIVTGWTALATLGNVSTNRHYLALRIADIDPDVWMDDNLTERKLSPWQIVCAGYRLSLPTPREYQQRIRAIEQARVSRQTAIEQAAQDRMTGRKKGTRPSQAAAFRDSLAARS